MNVKYKHCKVSIWFTYRSEVADDDVDFLIVYQPHNVGVHDVTRNKLKLNPHLSVTRRVAHSHRGCPCAGVEAALHSRWRHNASITYSRSEAPPDSVTLSLKFVYIFIAIQMVLLKVE